MNDSDTLWKCANIARRTSKMTFCASRELIHWSRNEVKAEKTTTPTNSRAMRSIARPSPRPAVATVTARPIM